MFSAKTKQQIVIAIMGFSSGLPLALSANTLQAWYTLSGLDLVSLGALGLVGQPYVFKFLWAPLFDRIRPSQKSLRLGWVLGFQLTLAFWLVLMAFGDPATHPWGLALMGLGLAFWSSSQDIVLDAYKVEQLSPEQRGLGAAWSMTGYRLAMLASGGGALILAQYWGFAGCYLFFAGLMLCLFVCTCFAQETIPANWAPAPSIKKAYTAPLKEYLSRKHALAWALFIVLYKLGDAFSGAMLTPFLLREIGFTLADVGIANKVVGFAATLGGLFIGGVLLNKQGLLKSLWTFGILQGVSNLVYLTFLLYPDTTQNLTLLWTMVAIDSFTGGLGSSAFLVLLMQLCHPQFTVTQYALLSCLAGTGRVLVSPLAGWVAQQYGWIDYFILGAFLAIPGLLLLKGLSPTLNLMHIHEPTERPIP